jgi:hypothetical protein
MQYYKSTVLLVITMNKVVEAEVWRRFNKLENVLLEQ